MADFSGRTIDNYLLLRRLGSGAFGEVYLAEHRHRKTLFALKMLRSQLNQENLKAFLNEARVMRLIHPNIIRVQDFGIDGDIPFIVMDYLPSGTLRELHPRGKALSLKMIVAYVKQVAEALQYAHDEGLVHRDVKPENMLIGTWDEIVLSDFGIVTTSYTWGEASQGGSAGTIMYMAPEQIQARAVRASDQYALAALAYEWLVGVPPFLGNMTELAAKHLHIPPPSLCERDPTIPPEVEQVVLKALEKDPTRRFSSVREFALALEQAAKLPIGTTFQALPISTSLLSSLAWCPDDTRLAIAGGDGAVYVWRIEQSAPLLLSAEHYQQVTAVAWSFADSRLASVGGDRLVRIWDSVAGNVLTTCIGHVEEVLTVAWSPDSTRLVSAGADRVMRIWDAVTGQTITILASHGDDILCVAWSPDGTRIASASYDGTVQVHEVESQKQVWLASSTTPAYALAWSYDSAHLAVAHYDSTVLVREAMTGQVSQTYRGHSAGVFALSWSPDGRWIASGSDDTTVQIWEPATGQLVFIYRGHTRGIRTIAWSSQGGNEACIASAGLDQVVLIWQAP